MSYIYSWSSHFVVFTLERSGCSTESKCDFVCDCDDCSDEQDCGEIRMHLSLKYSSKSQSSDLLCFRKSKNLPDCGFYALRGSNRISGERFHVWFRACRDVWLDRWVDWRWWIHVGETSEGRHPAQQWTLIWLHHWYISRYAHSTQCTLVTFMLLQLSGCDNTAGIIS